MQTTFGEGKGNCFAACMASILELPIEDVPNFCIHKDWFQRARDFVRPLGMDLIYIRFSGDKPGFLVGNWWIAGGKSPRGDFLHAVVCKDGGLVHDPHPSGDFFAGAEIEDAVLFTVPDPSRLAGARRAA